MIAADITLDNINKAYGGVTVIPGLDARIEAGKFTVILGPSGCGKSTLLNMIAGLEEVSGGRILIGDREVQNIPPKDRGLAMVFQNYALYPHMNVAENIGYSLKVAGVGKADRQKRVAGVAAMLGLSGQLEKRPAQLSGGQRQRVAIGRAIVREPKVLLFDEPLSNLDAQLRHDMRIELADLHKRIGATSLFVTHDQVEALTLADRIMVLNHGKIEQFATPREIYHHPATVFVASFLGSPPMNILPVTGDGAVLRLSDGQVVSGSRLTGPYQLGIRPEHILVDEPRGGPTLMGQVRFREDLGSHFVLAVDVGGSTLRIATPLGAEVADRHELSLTFPQSRQHLFDAQTGQAIGVCAAHGIQKT
ncbi:MULTISPECIES: sn-glycerol-3-phosphate ABC transporter ATP-binding protein UgpC [unclassified Mesorhizobium]|uniref:ABC transporter ATP-binding protein n=2 Tax=Mesorhizobium TaxID=68287 RepID=UPI000FD215C4|nr:MULTISPECIES: sn-glycerol-3-phosphate ABC transporter ATP-binding protein UgpC [unclassified Mesorhizobium]RUV25082.1 sn-glycerol-3-phosphate ABC transporter ATP-binding protein UgpC [Mesorhizobium sp. M5C.F.Ca.IN.020.32.2.1]RWH55706.1 MAG: sn-glycerol-3-phosphate ABC transporter ATP-binding protein UgpC [Mesorhizobium sp.]RWI70704.1 MAG: sn-glycerol-3-phosphate ABC transporter ATP-binding protein UgpC [Mesorhizobium sp.]RWI77698.1 MAG: sn-glycerol-3-phosphate ABC transporter ATP-binding pro